MIAIPDCEDCQRCSPGLGDATYHNSRSTGNDCYTRQYMRLSSWQTAHWSNLAVQRLHCLQCFERRGFFACHLVLVRDLHVACDRRTHHTVNAEISTVQSTCVD